MLRKGGHYGDGVTEIRRTASASCEPPKLELFGRVRRNIGRQQIAASICRNGDLISRLIGPPKEAAGVLLICAAHESESENITIPGELARKVLRESHPRSTSG